MTAWADLPDHDKLMITAAKNRAPVLVNMPHGQVRGTLIAWMPRTNQPVARVQFGTGSHRTVRRSDITLIEAPTAPVVEPVGYDRRRSMA